MPERIASKAKRSSRRVAITANSAVVQYQGDFCAGNASHQWVSRIITGLWLEYDSLFAAFHAGTYGKCIGAALELFERRSACILVNEGSRRPYPDRECIPGTGRSFVSSKIPRPMMVGSPQARADRSCCQSAREEKNSRDGWSGRHLELHGRHAWSTVSTDLPRRPPPAQEVRCMRICTCYRGRHWNGWVSDTVLGD